MVKEATIHAQQNMDTPLTRRQQAVLDYLRLRERQGAYPPTLEEICQALGLKSRGSLHKHIQALVDARLVEPPNGRQRGVRLLQEDPIEERECGLPFFGYIAAGRPIEAIATPQYMEVPAALRSDASCYVLQVRGDSMVEDGILDGDWVVIEQRDHARNGDVVVALVDGHEATLKRLEQSRNEVVLHPANGTMQALRYAPHRVRIQGVLVGQMRRYR